MSKTYCPGSHMPVGNAPHRLTHITGDVLVECPRCKRILKPTPGGRFRQHQPRNKNTASQDSTRDTLWAYGLPAPTVQKVGSMPKSETPIFDAVRTEQGFDPKVSKRHETRSLEIQARAKQHAMAIFPSIKEK